jgi:hypothetical protein
VDDRKIIIRSTRPTREAVILQPDTRVGFVMVLGDVTRGAKVPWEMSGAYGASKCLWTRPFKTEVVSFVIITAPMRWVPHALLGLLAVVPWMMLLVHLRFRSGTWSVKAATGRKSYR